MSFRVFCTECVSPIRPPFWQQFGRAFCTPDCSEKWIQKMEKKGSSTSSPSMTEVEKLQLQLEIQTKRVENLKKSNEFYISYLDDSDVITGKQRDRFGGKFARSCQAIDQELEKELENLK